MKFRQYLTEASGKVWLLALDVEQNGSIDLQVSVYSTEAKMVEDMLMNHMEPEIQDIHQELMEENPKKAEAFDTAVKNCKTWAGVQRLINKHSELGIYDSVFMVSQTKIDA